jgi:hypothetical protein
MADRDILGGELPPLSPRISITRADRSAVYNAVKKELDGILNGPGSYVPDGLQITNPNARLTRLNGLIQSLKAMRQNEVNDPDGVLESVAEDLRRLHEAASGELDNRDRNIVLDPNVTPDTRDRNDIYVSPAPDPYSPNPLKPENWKKYQDASLRSLEPSDLNSPSFHNDVGNTFGGQPLGSPDTTPQPTLPVQNLTTRALRMKGVPEADISAAVNNPTQMKNLLNRYYGQLPVIPPGGDRGGSGNRIGQFSLADQPGQAPTPTAATPDTYLPFGWAGLPALQR